MKFIFIWKRFLYSSKYQDNNNNNNNNSYTLAIIKPDIIIPYLKKKKEKISQFQEIIQTIEKNNLLIVDKKQFLLTKEKAEYFYQEHKGKFFFQRLISFMTSGPIFSLILKGNNAILQWRYLMGPTHSEKARITTIVNNGKIELCLRGKYGTSDTRNCLHGSDSKETAIKEIKFFFPQFEFQNN